MLCRFCRRIFAPLPVAESRKGLFPFREAIRSAFAVACLVFPAFMPSFPGGRLRANAQGNLTLASGVGGWNHHCREAESMRSTPSICREFSVILFCFLLLGLSSLNLGSNYRNGGKYRLIMEPTCDMYLKILVR